MSELTVVGGDLFVRGNLSAQSMSVASGSVSNASVVAAAGIDSSKVIHRYAINYSQASGSAVVAAAHILHLARASGTIVSVEALVEVKATGADRTIDVDVLLGSSGSSYATILTAPIEFDDGSTNRAVVSGTLATASYIDNDSIKISVTVAGAAGAQATGLCVVITLAENPQ